MVGKKDKDTTGNSYKYIERYAKDINLSAHNACLKVLKETEKVLNLILKGGNMTLETKCRLHWKRLGITNTQTLKAYIQSIFSKHDHQKNVMADLYKLVLPDWEKIEKIEGYPEAGRELSIFISEQFMQFDRRTSSRVHGRGSLVEHRIFMPKATWIPGKSALKTAG